MTKNNFDDIYYPEGVKELIERDTDQKMIDRVRSNNADYLDTLATTYLGAEVSYREMFDNIAKYAKSLKKYGISKGDVVTICLPNTPETIFYIYACNEIGAIPYMIDPRCTFGKISSCIQDSKAPLLICEMGTYYKKIAKYIDKLPVENIVVVSPVNIFDDKKHRNSSRDYIAKNLYDMKMALGELQNAFRDTRKKYSQKEFMRYGEQLVGNYSSDYDPEVPAIIVNTSGTSGGSVKGAMHYNKSYNILTNQTKYISKDITRGATYYGYIPYFSMYGSAVGMHTGLTHGVVVDNIPKFEGKKSLEEILRNKPNILIGVPSLFDKLTVMAEKEQVDMSHAKLYVMGGDNVDPNRLREENETLARLGMPNRITYGYGSTEAMMVNTTSDDPRSYAYGSCGIPYPGVVYKVIDPDTDMELENGQEGEIFVHTPSLMKGYLNKPEENELVFREIDGLKYFRTGDKGYISDTGHLYFTGRYKRLMKRPDGHQVSPIPIENSISINNNVDDCAVVGITLSGQNNGVIPTAFISLKNRKEIEKNGLLIPTITKIIEESLQNLSGEREMALAYVVVDSIPYTENGKMDFKKLENNQFDSLDYYIIDDAITRDYFKNVPNAKLIKINKTKVRTLKKS